MLGKGLRDIAASFTPMRTALADRAFAAYALTNMLSFIGFWMQRVILAWLVWDLTHSGFWLGILSLCDLAPALVLVPIGGVLGDRMDQSRLIFVCQVVYALTGLGLALYAGLGGKSVLALIAFAAVGGCANVLMDAARVGILRQITTSENFGPSVALASITFNIARFAGPALGGGILAGFGSATGFAAAALINAPFLVVLLRMKRTAPSMESAVGERRWLSDLVDGVAYTMGHPSIGKLLIVFAFVCFLVRPAYELMPGLVNEMFGHGVGGFSTMITAIGIGAVLAALNIGRSTGSADMERIALRGAYGGAIALLLLVLAPTFSIGIVFAAALGYFVSTCANGVLILVQTQSDTAYQARVASLWSTVVRAGPTLGALIIGAIADKLGFRWPIAVGGVFAILGTFVLYRVWRNNTVKA